MPSLPETLPNANRENFFDSLVRYWPLVLGAIFVIAGYVNLQSKYVDLDGKESANETSILTANANYAQVSPQLSALNAKIDILLKHDNFQ